MRADRPCPEKGNLCAPIHLCASLGAGVRLGRAREAISLPLWHPVRYRTMGRMGPYSARGPRLWLVKGAL